MPKPLVEYVFEWRKQRHSNLTVHHYEHQSYVCDYVTILAKVCV